MRGGGGCPRSEFNPELPPRRACAVRRSDVYLSAVYNAVPM